MALALLADVRRVLRITTADANRDAQLTAALETAEAWFRARARNEFDELAPATARFYEVAENSVVHLPVPGSTVIAVRVGSPGFLRTLATSEFIVMDDRRVRLRAGFYWPWPSDTTLYEERSGASAVVEVVEVDYTPPATVPFPVRDGVARLAASLWASTPEGDALATGGPVGVTEEKIGDYSYKLGRDSSSGGVSGDADDLHADAMRLLRPYVGPRVSVT